MDSNRLSQRLLHVAKHVPKGARLADIGSDHAYLPVYLAKRGLISYAVAGEVAQGPHMNASRVIQQANVGNIVQSRLGNGLAAFTEADQIDTITICGMGGALMVDILNASPAKLATRPLLILQPNIGMELVRSWLAKNYYQIVAEDILRDLGHVYEMMVAKPVTKEQQLTADEIFFGPCLLQQKDPAFIEKWTRELKREEKIHDALTIANKENTPKYREVQAKIKQIKGVL